MLTASRCVTFTARETSVLYPTCSAPASPHCAQLFLRSRSDRVLTLFGHLLKPQDHPHSSMSRIALFSTTGKLNSSQRPFFGLSRVVPIEL